MDRFVHLEAQSAFSFLWGTFTPEDLVRETVSLGLTAAALTDYGLNGAIRFYKAATAAGIQPIVGARIRIWDESIITLLARNFTGYGNLCRLLSIALADKMTPKVAITKQDLKHWSGGLVCLATGRGAQIGPLGARISREGVKLRLAELRDMLAHPEHLFVVIRNHAADDDPTSPAFQEALELMRETVDLASELDLQVVAANLVTFLKAEDYILHRTLVGVQRRHHHRKISPLPNDRFYLASFEGMRRRVPFPEALENTALVASLCKSFTLPVGELHPPTLQEHEEASKKLAAVSFKETGRLYRPVPTEYLRQLDQELQAVNRLELADFFLLVRQVVEFARGAGIRHSVRGSAAGSLLVYLLLGGVDPIAHNLLFERFINEGRYDLPDIDIDFDSDRRDDVIHYLLDLLPRQTTMVATIHKLRVRSAVRLVARSLGYPLNEIKRLAESLPWSLRGRNLLDALEKLPELRDTPLRKEESLVRLAAKLTGLPFQCSVHLGGVLIAPGDIKDWTPVGRSPKGMPVGQIDKDDAEALGLLKLDLLGLRMHTAIRKALEILEEAGTPLELDRHGLDDRKTYALLRTTESVGVFQLESPGQRGLLGCLQPRIFSDLIAEISLFRPGPVEGDMVSVYVRRRNGEEDFEMLHPDLEPILDETYGVIVFQEQVLRVVHEFAGLSYAEADAFRRAMTKDRRSNKMPFLKKRFLESASGKGAFEGVGGRSL